MRMFSKTHYRLSVFIVFILFSIIYCALKLSCLLFCMLCVHICLHPAGERDKFIFATVITQGQQVWSATVTRMIKLHFFYSRCKTYLSFSDMKGLSYLMVLGACKVSYNLKITVSELCISFVVRHVTKVSFDV